MQQYYDNWGHRVYMFYSDPKTHTWRKPNKNEAKTFFYNTDALGELSVSHVLSVIKVTNANELGWKFEETFCAESVPYCIHLYSLPYLNKS